MSTATRAAIVALYVVVFWLALPAALFFAGRAAERALALDALTPRPLVGGALVVVGLGFLFAAMRALRTEGRGLPVSALPPPKLVVRGPYRVCRHPIYVGFHTALVGVALARGETGLALVVAPLFTVAWVGYALVEERGLARRFGAAYAVYRRHVALWPGRALVRAVRLRALRDRRARRSAAGRTK